MIKENTSFVWKESRSVSRNGMVILRDSNADHYIYGEITYKWILYAAVDEEYEPPYTGFLGKEGKIWLLMMAGSAAMVVFLSILLIRKKKKS